MEGEKSGEISVKIVPNGFGKMGRLQTRLHIHDLSRVELLIMDSHIRIMLRQLEKAIDDEYTDQDKPDVGDKNGLVQN